MSFFQSVWNALQSLTGVTIANSICGLVRDVDLGVDNRGRISQHAIKWGRKKLLGPMNCKAYCVTAALAIALGLSGAPANAQMGSMHVAFGDIRAPTC